MKRILILCAIVALLMVYASPAGAVSVIDWTWSLETTEDGDTDTQLAPTTIDTGAPEYQYSWTITRADVSAQIDDLPEPPQEFSILADVNPISGSGNSFTLPISIPTNPVVMDLPEIGARISMAVLTNGTVLAQVSNVDLRTVEGGGGTTHDVINARFEGTLQVTAVPEPATIMLLGLGSITLIGKRKRRV
jgi:hypothetical protein